MSGSLKPRAVPRGRSLGAASIVASAAVAGWLAWRLVGAGASLDAGGTPGLGVGEGAGAADAVLDGHGDQDAADGSAAPSRGTHAGEGGGGGGGDAPHVGGAPSAPASSPGTESNIAGLGLLDAVEPPDGQSVEPWPDGGRLELQEDLLAALRLEAEGELDAARVALSKIAVSGQTAARNAAITHLARLHLAAGENASALARLEPLISAIRATEPAEVASGRAAATTSAAGELSDDTAEAPAEDALGSFGVPAPSHGAVEVAARSGGWPSAVLFVLGDAWSAMGEHEAAAAAYRAHAGAAPDLADVAELAAGNEYAAEADLPAAAAAYARARAAAAAHAGAVGKSAIAGGSGAGGVTAGDADGIAVLAGIRYGNTMLQLGDAAAALDAYRTAFEGTRNDAERAQALAGIVGAHEALGDADAARLARLHLVEELPSSAPAAVSLGRLEASGAVVAPAVRSAVLGGAGKHAEALAVIDAALAEQVVAAAEPTGPGTDMSEPGFAPTAVGPPDGSGRSRVVLGPGQRLELELRALEALWAMDEDEELIRRAEGALSAAAEAAAVSPAAAEVAFLRARALESVGRTEEAIAAYADLARAHPRSERAPEALWRRGLALSSGAADLQGFGLGDAAAAAFAELFDRYPGYLRAPDLQFRAGFAAWRAGNVGLARERWSRLADSSETAIPAQARARAAYWLGRADAERGDGDGADARWRQAAAADAGGFYGLRAGERLGLTAASSFGSASAGGPGSVPVSVNQAQFDAGPAPLGEDLDPVGFAEIAAWLAGWRVGSDGGADGGLSDAATTVADDPRVRRAEAWLDIGHRQAAARSLSAAVRAAMNDSAASATLALRARSLGLHGVSIAAAAAAREAAPEAVRGAAPEGLLRLIYPDVMAPSVLEAADAGGVQPALLFALIHQESRFEPGAISPAGATGLTQVMPTTGEGIARQLGDDDFSSADLLRSSVGLRYGSWYLAQQLRAFEGREAVALAAYNGGPGNASRWWAAARGDEDEFVEVIDYPETRAYVLKVSAARAMYDALYPWRSGSP